MKRFKNNSKKDRFLSNLATTSIDSGDLAARCKFNFSYFHHDQAAACDFSDLDKGFLVELFNKLKAYSSSSLLEWTRTRVGRTGRTVLEIYGAFPKKSEFLHPPHVPHDAQWARFRLESAVRLVGFVIPPELSQTSASKCNASYCANTFYVVFIDMNHKFYLTDK